MIWLISSVEASHPHIVGSFSQGRGGCQKASPIHPQICGSCDDPLLHKSNYLAIIAATYYMLPKIKTRLRAS